MPVFENIVAVPGGEITVTKIKPLARLPLLHDSFYLTLFASCSKPRMIPSCSCRLVGTGVRILYPSHMLPFMNSNEDHLAESAPRLIVQFSPHLIEDEHHVAVYNGGMQAVWVHDHEPIGDLYFLPGITINLRETPCTPAPSAANKSKS